MSQYKIVLAGAPSVGKSAIYSYIHREVNLADQDSRLRPAAAGREEVGSCPPHESLPEFSAGHQLFSYKSGPAAQRKTVSH